MPIYTFNCECGHSKEKILGINEDAPKCDICGGDMAKVITSPAIVRVSWGNVISRSKGYREGYSKEYLKDNPPSTA